MLKTYTLKQAVLYPVTHSIGKVLDAGLIDKRLPKRFRHHRHGKPCEELPDDTMLARPKQLLEGEYIYGGVLTSHFGHMIAEFCHRLWIMDEMDENHLPIIFAGGFNKSDHGALLPQIMAYFGVTSYQVITEPTLVERLIVPQQAKEIARPSKAGYQRFLGKLAERNGLYANPNSPEKVAILRAHLASRKVIGEEVLQAHLRAEGYEIYYPEHHKLLHQLQTVAGARQLVMADGSAGHLFDLLPHTGGQVFVYGRNRVHRLSQTSIASKVDRVTEFLDFARVAMPVNAAGGRSPNNALMYTPMAPFAAKIKDAGFIANTLPDLNVSQIVSSLRAYNKALLHNKTDEPLDEDELLAELVLAHYDTAARLNKLKSRSGLKNQLRRALRKIGLV